MRACLLFPPPEFFEGDALVCNNFQGLINCLDESAILAKASDDHGIELAIRIALFKHDLMTDNPPDWSEVSPPDIESHFRELCQKICADGGSNVPGKILRAIVKTVKGIDLSATHALRKSRGANSPQRKRCSYKAWRRDIDRELHIHYWECPNGAVKLASVVYHDDFSIPE